MGIPHSCTSILRTYYCSKERGRLGKPTVYLQPGQAFFIKSLGLPTARLGYGRDSSLELMKDLIPKVSVHGPEWGETAQP